MREPHNHEAEAVRTTIVGGRPPGCGRNNVPVPRGIEVLVKKAAVDAEFRELLMTHRGKAAASIGLEIDPAERAILSAIPREQLARVVDQTEVGTELRPAFMGRAAAVMLAALGAGLASGVGPAGAQPQSSTPTAYQTQPAPTAPTPPPGIYEAAGAISSPGRQVPMVSTNPPDTLQARPPIVGGASGGMGAGVPRPRVTAPPTDPATIYPGNATRDPNTVNNGTPRQPLDSALATMFGPNSGAAGQLTIPEVDDKAGPALHGSIGMGTWDTQVEFKDILVQSSDNSTLLMPSFASGLEGWQRKAGKWEGASGLLTQSDRAINCQITFGEATWTNYSYSLKARRTDGTEGFLIIFAAENSNTLYWWNIGGWGDTRTAIEKMTTGSKREIPGTAVDLRIETGTWYEIKIVVHGNTADCYFDGKLITRISQDKGYSSLTDAGPPRVFNNGNGPRRATDTRPAVTRPSAPTP